MPTYDERVKTLVRALVDQGKINPDDLEKVRKAQEEKKKRETEAKK